LATTLAPEARIEYVGIRPGEKLHEQLLMSDEARHTVDTGDRYVVLPEFHAWTRTDLPTGAPLEDGFVYSSETNDQWLESDGLRTFLGLPEVALSS
jgi:UDP-N-acetylglucosamine 4,6-dehydratase